MADPGEGPWGGPGPPLIPPHPLISRSESSTDLSSDRLKFSDRICNWPLSGYCMAAIITLFVDLNDFFRYFKSWEAMNLTSSAYLEVMSKLVNMFFFSLPLLPLLVSLTVLV